MSHDKSPLHTGLPQRRAATTEVESPASRGGGAVSGYSVSLGASDAAMGRLGAALIQLRRATGGKGERDRSVQDAASAGVQQASGRLPHLDRIQTSFGRHDVSGVKAQVGGPARKASQAMGAMAYATGDRVGFGDSPDLFTAAHEAAHVVQQRKGVSLRGGVGAAGDAYEQHADAVAKRVVEGRSAEALLDRFASGGTNMAVQRQEGDGEAMDAEDDAAFDAALEADAEMTPEEIEAIERYDETWENWKAAEADLAAAVAESEIDPEALSQYFEESKQQFYAHADEAREAFSDYLKLPERGLRNTGRLGEKAHFERALQRMNELAARSSMVGGSLQNAFNVAFEAQASHVATVLYLTNEGLIREGELDMDMIATDAEAIDAGLAATDMKLPDTSRQLETELAELDNRIRQLETAHVGISEELLRIRASAVSASVDDEKKELKDIQDKIKTLDQIGSTVEGVMTICATARTMHRDAQLNTGTEIDAETGQEVENLSAAKGLGELTEGVRGKAASKLGKLAELLYGDEMRSLMAEIGASTGEVGAIGRASTALQIEQHHRQFADAAGAVQVQLQKIGDVSKNQMVEMNNIGASLDDDPEASEAAEVTIRPGMLHMTQLNESDAMLGFAAEALDRAEGPAQQMIDKIEGSVYFAQTTSGYPSALRSIYDSQQGQVNFYKAVIRDLRARKSQVEEDRAMTAEAVALFAEKTESHRP